MHRVNWKAIKALIDATDVSLAVLAESLSVTTQTLLGWKRGANEPRTSQLAAFAQYFGVKIDDLIIHPSDFKFTEIDIAESEEGTSNHEIPPEGSKTD